MIKHNNPIIGIVMKPILKSQFNGSIWKELFIKQDFADVLSKHSATCIGIIPHMIPIDREVSNDIDLSNECELSYIEKTHLISQMELCDGIILQGGLSSHKYEVFIANYAIKHNIPLLGICAGFNNIARAIGIDVEYDEELAKLHDIYSTKPCHEISICDNGNLLNKVLNDKVIRVNSVHSMILNISTIKLNNRIVVEATAQNTRNENNESVVTVEAFSIKNVNFCLAIKWHPELCPDDNATKAIFNSFIKACSKYKYRRN